MRRRNLVSAAALLAVSVSAIAWTARAETRPEHGYVTDALQLPTTSSEARTLGRDLDRDGQSDNALGQFFSALVTQGLDLTAAENDAVTSGAVVMLHSLRTKSLRNSKHATWQVWYGDPTTDPDLTGSGTFTLPPAQPHSERLPARIKNHKVRTAAGNVPVRLTFGGDAFELQLTNAKVFATCSKASCTQGRINGAISSSQVDNTLIPQIAMQLQTIVVRDCPGPGPDSCTDGSTGKSVEQLFDANQDLVVTADELRDNSLVKALLAPDVDLLGADGQPGHDGVDDSMSFGFGFTGVHATLARG